MVPVKADDDNLWRIRRVGRFFSALWGGLAGVVPVLIAINWYFALPPAGLLNDFVLYVLHLVVVLLTAGPLVLGLLRLKRLFALYGEGIMFGRENVAKIREFGSSLVLFGLTQLAYFPLSSLVAAGNPSGRSINISFSSGAAVALGAGFVVVVIAWVMEEARKLEEEQSYTV